jgi:hypothetical protein
VLRLNLVGISILHDVHYVVASENISFYDLKFWLRATIGVAYRHQL